MNKNVLILVTLTVISFVVVLGFVFKDRLFCQYDDSNLCQFVNTMPEALAGEFLTPQGTRIVWKWNQANQEVIQMRQGTEIFHVIHVDDTVYVKNIAEDRWWRQTREESSSYGTQLMFDPSEYFSSLKSALHSKDTEITPLGSGKTAQGSCRMYRVKSNDQYDICVDRGKLVMIQLTNALQSMVSESEVAITAPQYGITDAPPGKNIMLDALENATSRSTPSYVRQFEQERIEAEKQGNTGQAPIYVLPTPTVSQ